MIKSYTVHVPPAERYYLVYSCITPRGPIAVLRIYCLLHNTGYRALERRPLQRRLHNSRVATEAVLTLLSVTDSRSHWLDKAGNGEQGRSPWSDRKILISYPLQFRSAGQQVEERHRKQTED